MQKTKCVLIHKCQSIQKCNLIMYVQFNIQGIQMQQQLVTRVHISTIGDFSPYGYYMTEKYYSFIHYAFLLKNGVRFTTVDVMCIILILTGIIF